MGKKEYLLHLLEDLEEKVFDTMDIANIPYKRDEYNFVHSCDAVKDLFKVLYTEIDELWEEE